ncbi:aculeacin A acylase [Deinococcus metallilatus]|nr:aculeacin A acylase [Deinococcus metallilatus]
MHTARLRSGRVLGVLAPLLLGSSLASTYQVQIQRTSYGIPHVRAADLGSLGYGLGYAYAQDNLCLLADQVLTVRGERSRYLGTADSTIVGFQQVNNLDSDFFFRALIDLPALRRAYQSGPPEHLHLMQGYAAGYNRYLRDTPPGQRPEACRNADWVRPISEDDVMRLLEEKAIQASAGSLVTAIARTVPPGAGAALPAPDLAAFNAQYRLNDLPMGSNGWAFGAQATENGRGLLLGNPHFPWQTTNRFYELHLTIPGQLDVMGASLGGMPIVNIGFNRDVAWTHTVSTDKRFTLYALHLAPGDPTRYVKDGVTRPLRRRTVIVEVKDGDRIRVQSRTLYSTPDGPLISLPQAGLNWTATTAFALRDANHNNTRMIATWLDIGRASSVQGVRRALDQQGIPWVNTLAADRSGQALYADISSSPNVSAAQQARCTPPALAPLFKAAGLAVLDGSRSACDWAIDPASKVRGLRAPEHMPALIRQDYFANSNDSAWLTNLNARIENLDPIVGDVNVPQRPRTRMGLTEITRRLNGEDGLPGNRFNLGNLQEILLSDRNFTGLLLADDAVKLCQAEPKVTLASGEAVDLQPACDTLARWDRRSDLPSVGAYVWREFWRRASSIPGVYAVPFDPADPVNTPRGLNTADASVRSKLLQAFGDAVALLKANHIAPDRPLGEVQGVIRNGVRIPLHGAPEFEGVLNKIEPPLLNEQGYVGVVGTSSSYIQTVTFDEAGPVAQAILTYSQSADPASPHYADQTVLFSQKTWVTLPFTPAAIQADPALRTLELSE